MEGLNTAARIVDSELRSVFHAERTKPNAYLASDILADVGLQVEYLTVAHVLDSYLSMMTRLVKIMCLWCGR